MSTEKSLSRRTIVYVDGYNLYDGRLRGTTFKWLDLVKLSQGILEQRDQNETLQKVRFFTAPALATFATHGAASVEAQSAYHRALKALYGPKFEVINGAHSIDHNGTLLPTFVANQPYDRTRRVRVWKIEEKKTDVNLAISMYRDACKSLVDRIVLISNDSDAEPALLALREDFPHIKIGVVMPIMPLRPGAKVHRRPSGSLAQHADWTINDLSDAQLLSAQLPSLVPTKKKPIKKPPHW